MCQRINTYDIMAIYYFGCYSNTIVYCSVYYLMILGTIIAQGMGQPSHLTGVPPAPPRTHSCVQGPKFRVGELAGEPVQLNNGDILEFGTLAICAVFGQLATSLNPAEDTS